MVYGTKGNVPRISVVMPAYNAEAYIEEAVLSILNQTYENFELIIIDDCSMDYTPDILRRLMALDPRISVIFNPTNLKIAKTLNIALQIARGDLIARMDADDVALPHRFKKQEAFLHANPDIALVGTAIEYIDKRGRLIGKNKVICGWEAINRVIHLRSPCQHPTWMVRRKVLLNIGGYRDVAPAEDYDLLLRLSTSYFRFDNLSEVCLRFRITEGGTAQTQGLIQRKAVNYVLALYRQRIRHGVDSFRRADFERFIEATHFAKLKFGISQRLLDKANRHRYSGKCLRSFFLMFITGALSWHQLQFLYRGYISRRRLGNYHYIPKHL